MKNPWEDRPWLVMATWVALVVSLVIGVPLLTLFLMVFFGA